MSMQNITLSIPKDTLRKVKLIAVKQGMSVSGLMIHILEDIVSREEGYQAARRRHLEMLENNTSLDTKGILSWTREDIHER